MFDIYPSQFKILLVRSTVEVHHPIIHEVEGKLAFSYHATI